MPIKQLLRFTLGARIFTFLALGAPVLWYRDRSALLALVALGVVWALASLGERQERSRLAVPVAEAGVIGLVCGFCVADSPVILVALAVPPFAAAVFNGLRMSSLAIGTELALVISTPLVVEGGLSADEGLSLFTWTMAGVGLAMIGSFVHAVSFREDDALAPYRDAQHLIRQLLDLSGELSSGLDVASLAGSIASDVRDLLPTSALGLYLPRGEVLMPLVTTLDDPDERRTETETLAVESWARGEPIVFGRCFAFPLGDAAVVAGELSTEVGLSLEAVERSILTLSAQLRSKAVQLDTALLFSDFRDLASADARKRLAREMHDGVAQDIASLGYLVDALAARPASEKQAVQLAVLRDRITKVVAEVRQSVLTLRTSIGESQSLGAAIGSVARHLSESSGVPISVTLDEQSARLRPSVEAELFRIAQESMNNAIKHAQCAHIEVLCQVHAPEALITVKDDGRGLQQARSDSHGVKIMRERARLAGGVLVIENRTGGGVSVSVRVGSEGRVFPRTVAAETLAP